MRKWTSNLLALICFGSLIGFVISGSSNLFLAISAVSLVLLGSVQYFSRKKMVNEKKKMQRELDERALSYFSDHNELVLNEHVVVRSEQAAGFDSLDVYYQNEKLCKVREFKTTFPDTYEYFKYVIYSNKDVEVEPQNIVEETEEKVNLGKFMYQIDSLNSSINNTKITEDLYHTTAMIKFIDQILKQYPDKQSKVSKLDYYYLPTLVSILNNYVRLSSTNKMDSDFNEVESQLMKTIYLVNQALETMSETLCDDEVLDLSSDMSVLETMLKKDGLVKEGTIGELKK